MDRPIRVLVIDDDEDFRASVRTMLEAEGYQVATAASGHDGLDLARASRPDVIVLDVMMESSTEGYVVNQSLKYCQDYECQGIPIIMCSSIADSPDELYPRAEEVGMIRPNVYLTKPLDIPLFLATVRRLAPHAVQA